MQLKSCLNFPAFAQVSRHVQITTTPLFNPQQAFAKINILALYHIKERQIILTTHGLDIANTINERVWDSIYMPR